MPQSNPKSGHRQNFSKICYRSLREKRAEAEYKASSRLAVKAMSRLGLGTASREKCRWRYRAKIHTCTLTIPALCRILACSNTIETKSRVVCTPASACRDTRIVKACP